MSTFYSSRTKIATAIFSFLFVAGFNLSAFSQCDAFPNTDCTTFGSYNKEEFTGGPQNFSGSGGIAYNNDAFRATVSGTGDVTYTIITPIYTISTTGNVGAGFSTDGSTASFVNYYVEIVRASDNVVLVTCLYEGADNAPAQPGPLEGPICYTFGTPGNQNVEVYFRISLTVTNSDGLEVIFDDFTYNNGQLIILPVSLTSFTARRLDNKVQLNWTTASESNNSGFEIQKRTTGSFETVAFVNTKAINGNSSTPLQYVFSDNNLSADASFYRIKMVDIDGKYKLSDIRSVNGLKSKAGILVYPNPAKKETVNVVFNSNEEKNIQLTDLNGRLIRNWQSYRNVDLKLENLLPGVYMLRVNNLVNNDKEVQKIIVTN